MATADITSNPASSPLDIATCPVQTLISAPDTQLIQALSTIGLAPDGNAPTRQQLLSAAVQVREALKKNEIYNEPKKAMERIYAMTVSELDAMSRTDAISLRDLMNRAHSFDNTLPPPPTTNDPHQLSHAAMTWKLKSLEKIQAPQNSALDTATPVDDAPPPLPHPLHLEAMLEKHQEVDPNPHPLTNDHHEPPRKKHKPCAVGGIQIIDENGKGTSNRPIPLGPYPGKTSSISSLCVTELIGSKLLRSLLRKGRCLETATAEVRWTRGPRGDLMAAEAEAYTLARILHLALLDHPTMEAALESSAWMEVAIRRLYALVYVENAIQTMNTSRSAAWVSATPMLESNPGSPGLLAEYDNALHRALAMNAKAQNAFKTIRTSQMKTNKPFRREHQRTDQRRDGNQN